MLILIGNYVKFDDTSSDDQIAKLHEKEEEEFLQIMSAKHGIPYADLSGVPVDTGAVDSLKKTSRALRSLSI